MAEGIENQGQTPPRIIIDAKGTEKTVNPAQEPRTEEPKRESRPEEPKSKANEKEGTSASEKAKSVLEGAAVGALAGEVIETAVKEGGKVIRKALYGGSGEKRRFWGNRGKEQTGESDQNNPPAQDKTEKKEEAPKALGNLNFEQIEIKLQDPNLNNEDRSFLQERRKRIIEDISNFDDKNFLRDTRNSFTTTLKTNSWDEVYSRLLDQGSNIDDQLVHSEGADPRWRGAVKQSFRAEAAAVLVAGIENKKEEGYLSDEWYKRHNYTDDEIDRLKRVAEQKHVFDFAPDAPEEIVGSLLEKKERSVAPPAIRTINQPIINAHELAQEIAQAQGLLSPFAYLEEAVDGEEFLKTAQRIVPGSEPRFWGILSPKEKDEWIVRSTLWIIAAKKSAAFSSDELCMDKMHDLAVELNKWALQVLLGDIREGRIVGEGKDGVLPAVGIYTTIIGDPRFLDYKDENDLSLKQVFFGKFNNSFVSLKADYGNDSANALARECQTFHNSCPDSIYPHDKTIKGEDGKPLKDKDGKEIPWGTNIDAEGFKMLRKSIRFWLATEGRDLLLTHEESQNREAFFKNPDALEIMKFRAREAEVIGWNFVYSQGLLETFDSRAYRPEGTKRHGPSSYWSLALWTTIHLQERFEQKVVRNDNSDSMEAKEEWAGNLGTWALNNYNRGSWTTEDGTGRKKIHIPKVLPDVLFRSGLFNKYIFESGRLANGEPSTEKDGESLFVKFNKIGNEVLFDTKSTSRFKLMSEIDWTKVSDTPFVSYIWDEIRWANMIEKFFKKGQGVDLSLRDFGEAARNLRLPTDVREKLLIVYFGVNVNSNNIAPKENSLSWGIRKEALKEYFPNLFLKE